MDLDVGGRGIGGHQTYLAVLSARHCLGFLTFLVSRVEDDIRHTVVIHVQRLVNHGNIYSCVTHGQEFAASPATQVVETETFEAKLTSPFTTDLQDGRIGNLREISALQPLVDLGGFGVDTAGDACTFTQGTDRLSPVTIGEGTQFSLGLSIVEKDLTKPEEGQSIGVQCFLITVSLIHTKLDRLITEAGISLPFWKSLLALTGVARCTDDLGKTSVAVLAFLIECLSLPSLAVRIRSTVFLQEGADEWTDEVGGGSISSRGPDPVGMMEN